MRGQCHVTGTQVARGNALRSLAPSYNAGHGSCRYVVSGVSSPALKGCEMWEGTPSGPLLGTSLHVAHAGPRSRHAAIHSAPRPSHLSCHRALQTCCASRAPSPKARRGSAASWWCNPRSAVWGSEPSGSPECTPFLQLLRRRRTGTPTQGRACRSFNWASCRCRKRLEGFARCWLQAPSHGRWRLTQVSRAAQGDGSC